MASPDDPASRRPASIDEWLQAAREQASFFTGLRLAEGPLRWRLADVLPVLPLVGAGVGLASGLAFAVVQGISGIGWLAAAIAVGAGVLITRALHEDGLADTADGLGPHGLALERRLEIMRDSRNGTFGVLALALAVLIKVAALASFGAATGLALLVAAHAVSRAALAYPLLAFAPVRDEGLAARLGKPADTEVWLTLVLGGLLAFLLLVGKGFFAAVLAPVLAVLAAAGAARWIAARIGGYTGDTLGAVQQVGELTFLVVAASLIAR
ncbi:MAG: adenosylcobinamide-GDP ribazoletransferase [Alphaproteobacteria bacterium]|nr:adenosylcobinamide-GDP ribazoletransferase [Alphaproteobacteria bacterium]